MIRQAVEKNAKVRFDRAHFKAFGDYALLFEVVYWIQDPDYTLYMDIQQAINIDMLKQFSEAGIKFAYSPCNWLTGFCIAHFNLGNF